MQQFDKVLDSEVNWQKKINKVFVQTQRIERDSKVKANAVIRDSYQNVQLEIQKKYSQPLTDVKINSILFSEKSIQSIANKITKEVVDSLK